jgi:hypothetical protein
MKTDLWPTTGVQFTSDEHASILAGMVAKNTSGVPRAGVFPRHTNALVTARPDMRVNVLPMELVHVKEGARFAALTESIDVVIPNPPSANTQYNIVCYVGTDEKLTGVASTSDFVVIPGTPSATPSDPALPNAAVPIARVAVPSTATATNSAGVVITSLHPFTAMAGGVLLFRSTSERDLWVAPAGQLASVMGSRSLFVSNGSNWASSGVDANGWTFTTLPSGKRLFYQEFAAWSPANSFGPQGGSNWSQTRQGGISPPVGFAWDDVTVQVSVYPRTAANGLQFLITGFLTQSTGAAAVNLVFVNPTATTISNTSMDLKSAITLIEK